MNKLILTIFIIWIIWKVLKSAFEELQRRMEDFSEQQGPERLRPGGDETRKIQEAPQQTVLTPDRAAVSREPDEWELGKPIPADEGNELEKWFSEAMERKRQLDDADEAIPLPVTERESVEPERPPAPRPQQVRRRVEPKRPRASLRETQAILSHRRQAQIDQLEITHSREQADVESPEDLWKRPPAPKKPKKARERRRRVVRERPAPGKIVCAGKWDMDRIRRGIILAEILGAPKGLRDIDSHVV